MESVYEFESSDAAAVISHSCRIKIGTLINGLIVSIDALCERADFIRLRTSESISRSSMSETLVIMAFFF